MTPHPAPPGTIVRRRLWFVAALLGCVFALAFDLGGYPLLDPDEGRNAEVAREMTVTGDYALPRLNGLPYLDKPVFYFAVTAASLRVFGRTVPAARLPSLAFTLATLALVWGFARRLYGEDGAWIATIATAATPFTLAYARTVIFDSALTFFVLAALAAFYVAIDRDTRSRAAGAAPESGGAWWSTLAWGAIAFGILTKGPIALALPLIVVVPFALWRRTWRALLDPVGVLLLLAIVGPWVLVMQREVPGFLEYVLVTETAQRLFTEELQRTGPFWYFLPLLPAAALPWSVVPVAGWRTLRRGGGRADPSVVYLLLWIALPLLFFSLSQSKRPQYLLPLIPAAGLLVAAVWTAGGRRPAGGRAAAVLLGLVAVLLAAWPGVFPRMIDTTQGIAAEIPATARALAIACAVASIVAWHFRRHVAVLAAALALPVIAIPFVSRTLMDEIGRERSAVELAQALEPHLSSATEVVGVAAFPLSLPFYLNRTLVLSTEDGTELTSNYLSRHLSEWMQRGHASLRPRQWWREALVTCGRPRVFVMRSSDRNARAFAEGRLTLLIDNGRYAAYGPCGVTDLAQELR